MRNTQGGNIGGMVRQEMKEEGPDQKKMKSQRLGKVGEKMRGK
jgi:hypothetical protein